MKFITLFMPIIIILLKTPLLADWSVPFNVSESGGSGSAEMSINFTSWFFKVVTVIICSFLLFKSASNLKSENYSGAFLAFLGATIVAIAPEILKSMFFNT